MDDTIVQNGLRLKELLNKKKDLEAALSNLNSEIEDHQIKFVELMEMHSMQKFSINDVGTFYLSSDLFPRILDRELLFQDLKARGAGDLIKPTVNAQTLKAYVKECLESKNEIPKGIETHTKTMVRIRKN